MGIRLCSLARGDDGVLRGVVEGSRGERTDVSFVTDTAGGKTVAKPEPDVFFHAGSVDEVRRVVAAVIAFEQASRM